MTVGRITALFNLLGDRRSYRNGARVTVLGEVTLADGKTVQRVLFPNGITGMAFNDELSEWRLQA